MILHLLRRILQPFLYTEASIAELHHFHVDGTFDINAVPLHRKKNCITFSYTVRKAKRDAGPQHKGDEKFRHPYR
jgi:hypothetical protein